MKNKTPEENVKVDDLIDVIDKKIDELDKEEKKQEKKKNKDLEKLTAEKNAINDKFLRLSAEMQNLMRRNEEEKSNMRKYEGEDLIKSLLSIVDDFERAINMDDDNLDDEVSRFLEGFKLIYANLLNILKSLEVKEIESLGKEFDPYKMNAVMTDSIVEEESNIVLDVLQKGYIYKDKVIRPAMVKVNE